jgi:hypothetical protein
MTTEQGPKEREFEGRVLLALNHARLPIKMARYQWQGPSKAAKAVAFS